MMGPSRRPPKCWTHYVRPAESMLYRSYHGTWPHIATNRSSCDVQGFGSASPCYLCRIFINYHTVSSYVACDGPNSAPALNFRREHTILVRFTAQRVRCSLCHPSMLREYLMGRTIASDSFGPSYQSLPSMACTPTCPTIHLAKCVERDMNTLLALLGSSLHEEHIPR
jgi:hypothetical protein